MHIINPYVINSAPLTLTYVDSKIATSSTITLPAGSATGDLAILFELVGGSAALGSPAGWTNAVTETTQANYHGRIAYRVLQSGDTGVTTGSTGSEFTTALFIYRPSRAIAAVTPSTFNKQGTTSNPTLQTVSASSGTPPLVVCALGGANSFFVFSTASPAFDYDLTATPLNTTARAAVKLYNSAPSDHSVDMNDEGANVLASGYLAVS